MENLSSQVRIQNLVKGAQLLRPKIADVAEQSMRVKWPICGWGPGPA